MLLTMIKKSISRYRQIFDNILYAKNNYAKWLIRAIVIDRQSFIQIKKCNEKSKTSRIKYLDEKKIAFFFLENKTVFF